MGYYSHDKEKVGPCSGRRTKELADCGGILPTDTVWKDGVERDVAASKVKNLFRPIAVLPPQKVPAAAPPQAGASVVEPRAAEPARRGAVLVEFRKKRTTCGRLDSSCNTMPIRSGNMRAGFYGPKCRKHRDVEAPGQSI